MAYEFQNTQHPQLQVTTPAGVARFHKGRLVTDDKALAVALAALPDGWHGVRAVSAPADEPKPVAPRGRRKGGDA